MNQRLLFLLFFSAVFATKAQTSTPSIEIAVHETVTLTIESAEMQLYVDPDYDQLEEALYDEFGWYDYYEYEYYDLNYEYEMLLEESPKKVTKEMKREYEERLKEEEEREKERMDFADSFVPFHVADLVKLLKEENIAFNLNTDASEEAEYDYDYDEYYGNDSIIEIVVKTEEEVEKINDIIEERSVESRFKDYSYASVEDLYLSAIPKLTEKARKQGDAIAASLGKKLGDVIEISNLYPDSYSYSSIDPEYDYEYDEYEYEYYYDDYDSNPFERKREETIRFVYRFGLMNN